MIERLARRGFRWVGTVRSEAKAALVADAARVLVSVWGPQAASKTQYLRVHMSSIRQKVEPDPSRPHYFVTVPGLGVRFDADGGAASEDAERLTPTG